ncbi:MAG: CarD family transcriptional regulator [Hyphomicrobiales bacterium]|nr:CarD family transcriptional regulator [Hyphomicrobiales bacterium]
MATKKSKAKGAKSAGKAKATSKAKSAKTTEKLKAATRAKTVSKSAAKAPTKAATAPVKSAAKAPATAAKAQAKAAGPKTSSKTVSPKTVSSKAAASKTVASKTAVKAKDAKTGKDAAKDKAAREKAAKAAAAKAAAASKARQPLKVAAPAKAKAAPAKAAAKAVVTPKSDKKVEAHPVKTPAKAEAAPAKAPTAKAAPASAPKTPAPAAKAAPQTAKAGAEAPRPVEAKAAPAKPAAAAKPVAPQAAAPAAPAPQAAQQPAAHQPAKPPFQRPFGGRPGLPGHIVRPTAKPGAPRPSFKANEFIVYPAHGVGQIVAIEEQVVAGFRLELFVISFVKDKMILKVPTPKVVSVGMRKLAEAAVVTKALETLTGRARIKRTMWSRRAQEYEAKINSGDLVAIAEVVRDLYRSDAQPEQSYSERQLYEAALDRMARELAAVRKLTDQESLKLIEQQLQKGPRRGAKPETEAAAGEDAGEGDVEEAA